MTPADLQEWRKQAGISQATLASLLGVTSTTVARWERGERRLPPLLELALQALQKEPVNALSENRSTNQHH